MMNVRIVTASQEPEKKPMNFEVKRSLPQNIVRKTMIDRFSTSIGMSDSIDMCLLLED
jgi:hypothetical protein